MIIIPFANLHSVYKRRVVGTSPTLINKFPFAWSIVCAGETARASLRMGVLSRGGRQRASDSGREAGKEAGDGCRRAATGSAGAEGEARAAPAGKAGRRPPPPHLLLGFAQDARGARSRVNPAVCLAVEHPAHPRPRGRGIPRSKFTRAPVVPRGTCLRH